MKEEIKKLQDTVDKLEKRVLELEQASRSCQVTKEATAINKAISANEATIRKLEND